MLEVHRAGDRLESRGEHRLARPFAGGRRTGSEHQVRRNLQPLRDSCKASRRHDCGTSRGQGSFVILRVALPQRVGHDQCNYRIAEELKALVGQARGGLLVDVATVDQRLRQQGKVVEFEAEALGQLPRRRHFGARPWKT
jgi:hypothetical protein